MKYKHNGKKIQELLNSNPTIKTIAVEASGLLFVAAVWLVFYIIV